MVDGLFSVHEALSSITSNAYTGYRIETKDQEFQVILGDIVSVRPTWDTKDPILRKKASELRREHRFSENWPYKLKKLTNTLFGRADRCRYIDCMAENRARLKIRLSLLFLLTY